MEGADFVYPAGKQFFETTDLKTSGHDSSKYRHLQFTQNAFSQIAAHVSPGSSVTLHHPNMGSSTFLCSEPLAQVSVVGIQSRRGKAAGVMLHSPPIYIRANRRLEIDLRRD